MKQVFLVAGLVLTCSCMITAQAGTLSVPGHPGVVSTVQVNGKNYVEIEALARLLGGSMGFQGDQIVLTLSSGTASSSSVAPSANAEFSREFLRAGIEAMTEIREWRAALDNAIKNSMPISEAAVAPYRNQALTSLRLVSVSASTDADKNGSQFIKQVFDKMDKLSQKIVSARAQMNYLSPDAVESDPLDHQILACARSLASMAADNQFRDDGACH